VADFARFLPLSMRGREDESDVASNRRRQLAEVVDLAAALVIGGGARADDLADAFAAQARLRDEFAGIPGDAAESRLTALAEQVRSGRRRSIRSLAEGARAVLILARDTGVPVQLPTLTAGAVALYAAGSAPLERRAVIKGRTVRAADGEWAFGTGAVLEAPGTAIAAFLLGVSDDPPRPPAA
jgi:hypothetical protein